MFKKEVAVNKNKKPIKRNKIIVNKNKKPAKKNVVIINKELILVKNINIILFSIIGYKSA